MPESRPQSFWFSLSAATLFVVAALASLTGVDPYSPDALWVLGACVVGLAILAAWFAWQAVLVRRRAAREVASAQERAAVLRERLLIASELHDVLSHGLGAITLRARAGTIGVVDDVAAGVLDEIAALSSAATSELRRLLLVLRNPEAASPLRPAVGIADVGELAEQMRAAGLEVDVAGLEVRAEAGAELLVYQVVREALKNALKHAGPTAVRCRIESDGELVHVVVADDGPRCGRAGSAGTGVRVGDWRGTEGECGEGGEAYGAAAGGDAVGSGPWGAGPAAGGAGVGLSADGAAGGGPGVGAAGGGRQAGGGAGNRGQAGSGHGLGLLAQLVAAAGGELCCGPSEHGFMVEAVIPGGGVRG
ncbi:MAG: histidine kinase [Buchananella hordeovulneris]|nr:histidine kinase [Buchananella hordeovulneris]